MKEISNNNNKWLLLKILFKNKTRIIISKLLTIEKIQKNYLTLIFFSPFQIFTEKSELDFKFL